jgi:hypothetical protein
VKEERKDKSVNMSLSYGQKQPEARGISINMEGFSLQLAHKTPCRLKGSGVMNTA